MTWPPRRSAVPAGCKDLDLSTVERALIQSRGGVSAAASVLNVPARDLRRLVWATPGLVDAAFELIEQAIDEAQAVLWEGLTSEDFGRRFEAAIFVLRHGQAARHRGWA